MSKKQSLTRRSLHYYWLATRNHLGLFVALVASTIGFCGFLTYGNPYVMSLIVDRISRRPGGREARCSTVFGPYIAALIGINVAGQACSKLQDYTLWKLQIAVNYDLGHHGLRLPVQPVAVVPLQPLRRHARQPDLQVHGRLHPAAPDHELPVFAHPLLHHLHLPHPVSRRAGLRGGAHGHARGVRGHLATSCTSASCT